MWVGTCCGTALLLLMPITALAQDGLRSASLPERPLTSTIKAIPQDVHRATAATYRPHPDRIPVPFVYGYQQPFVYPLVQPITVVQLPHEIVGPARVDPAPAPPALPDPYTAGTPGRPKLFYVIPGCYAGDRPPEPGFLAAGCNPSRLRVVQPS